MPKLGVKYFIGSFLLSLVAVFVATKAYLLLTLKEQQAEQVVASIKTKNIELFAINEEEDPLYQKFKEVSQPSDPLSESETDFSENNDDVLYTPEDETTDVSVSENHPQTEDTESEVILSDDNSVISDSAELNNETETATTTDTDDEDTSLDIVDAGNAPTFTIPLKHNYNVEGGTVTVSDEASNGKIALASHDVSIYNLGTENQADVTEPLAENQNVDSETSAAQSSELEAHIASPQMSDDDPWEVAETGNKHAAKNSLSVKSPQEEADVALPAQEVKTAYHPQQNILIPIPDEIMKEDNLTPQFSSSKENLQLEEELRKQNKLPSQDSDTGTQAKDNNATEAKTPASNDTDGPKIEVKPLPATIPADDNEKDFDEQNESNADDSTSKSLTDSITAWFSGVKNKAASLKSSASSEKSDSAKEASTDKKSGSSIFQKLLGPQEEEQNIAPSELKITFQPNKAEISGQTLEWLRAFADNTLKNSTVVVEIRASQAAPQAIQQKRLNLFYKLLADKGVDYHKINIIFTNREPNSFIIRNVRYASEEDMAKAVVKWGDNPW